MIFSGNIFTSSVLEETENGQIVQINFDLHDSPVNVFNDAVFVELNQVLDLVEKANHLAGLVFTSGKSLFVAGADIPNLLAASKSSKNDGNSKLLETMRCGHEAFDRIQSLPLATVAAINGFALGGGLEYTLAMDARVIAEQAKVGVPEVNLGVFPGWGGTVRLPRMIAPELAANWIATGKPQNAKAAKAAGLVSKICTQEELIKVAVAELKKVQKNYEAIRTSKMQPIALSSDSKAAIQEILTGLKKRPGPHYPAASIAVNSLLSQAHLPSLQANEIEIKDFVKIIKTDNAVNLLSVFLNEQAASRAARKHAKGAKNIDSVAVIGAGIMGGGIAYQSALKGIPALMKDINQAALELGTQEAERNFDTLLKKGKISEDARTTALDRITPTLENDEISGVDAIVEAVVENIDVKKSVIGDLENCVDSDTVIASNTSTILISRIAEDLQRPENFCGMHFFNPVPVMPLVEVIRGEKTSSETISRMVSYALQLGKSPVVVNDCPGFLVNRVLFPYINAAHMLINEGVDFQQLDAVMEQWGWPMGPAYLSDVIGIDTMVHCLNVMAADIPERMTLEFESANHIMFNNQRLGQKNGQGFYRYVRNEAGRMAKLIDQTSIDLIYPKAPHEIEAQEIEERLMVAICLEMVRCIEERVVASPAEADMAVLWGIGFPRFRGGVLRHIDTLGIESFCLMVEKYQHLGALYKMPNQLVEMRASGESFYSQ